MNIKKLLATGAPLHYLEALNRVALSAARGTLQIFLHANRPLPASWLSGISLHIVPADKGSPIVAKPAWGKDDCTIVGGTIALPASDHLRLGIVDARQVDVAYGSVTLIHAAGPRKTFLPPAQSPPRLPVSACSNPYIDIILTEAAGK